MGGCHDHSHGNRNERRLLWALGLTSAYLVAEVIAGLLTNSLALLSDAGHMLTDVAALAISLIAVKVAKRPADARRTYGYHRFEILAAALNASALFVVAAFILYEAYRRWQSPPEVQSGVMLLVAVIGLAVNLAGMRILAPGSESSLNVRGAYLEVWSDMLGSAGVIVAALVIRFTGWSRVDPIVAVLIGLWVLPRSWALLSESVNVLLEGVPESLVIGDIEKAILSVQGVAAIHDLHVWSITTGKVSLTAHLNIEGDQHAEQVMRGATEVLRQRFGIEHTTLQTEQGLICSDGRCGMITTR
jgi:cobalt-zinc-cadmium efflux system protein